jgi:esterase/lipase superfamily enzyme
MKNFLHRITASGCALVLAFAAAPAELRAGPSPEGGAELRAGIPANDFSSLLWSREIAAGAVAFEKGEFKKAVERFNAAVAEARKAPTAEEFLQISLNNLAQAHAGLRRHDVGETLLREALHICRQAPEPRPHATAILLVNLATNLCAQGRCGEAADFIAEADTLRRKALETRRRTGEDPWARSSGGLYLLTDTQKYVVVPVFFATDRRTLDLSDAERFFGNDRGDLQVGVCEVAVPLSHKMGEVSAPSWWKLEFSPDPERHISLLDVKPARPDDFFAAMGERLRASKKKRAFVFIHGFNATFADVARRAAQLSYDLGFDGVPVVYCWPSQASLSEQSYHIDRQNAEWTTEHLARFLDDMSRKLSAEESEASIALVAHSLGNQPLARALERLATRPEHAGLAPFAEVIFTAPDIDADVFRDLAPEIAKMSRRSTLYVSANDQALNYSRSIHGGLPRAGYSGGGVVFVAPGFETIEVSEVDTSLLGHGYYGENRSVLSDIYYLVGTGAGPDDRHGLSPMLHNGQRYWKFRP